VETSVAIPNYIRKISETLWEIPKDFKKGMRVPARIYATETLIDSMEEGVFDQISNVATLPGIVKYALCMPDGHWGYGFPIGGTAAFDPEKGVISPGGIGFDINCGMRLIKTDLVLEEVQPYIERLVNSLFHAIPTGVGGEGNIKINRDEFRTLAEQGARWCVKHGYGRKDDLERTEDGGSVSGADASKISERAVERGFKQVGTLGSGNHYLEIQTASFEDIFDPETAAAFRITRPNQVVVMFHCGSRGFGHQIATDYLKLFVEKGAVPGVDRELASAPFSSKIGRDYYAAMNCAINMAFANRQIILHRIREVFSHVFHRSPDDLGIEQVYDVAHNTARLEQHEIDGRMREILVHRKGATRALAPKMPGLSSCYRDTGQPVIIGGSMESGSYLLAGIETGSKTFYTTAHGSGRVMSRRKAKKSFDGRKIQREMEQRGIYVRTASYSGLAEEAGAAYKNIDDVVEATRLAGISRPVVRFRPIGNIKG